MGKLIDTDSLKEGLMVGLAPGKEFGEFIMMLVCGLIDDEPEAVVRCKDCLMHGVCRFEQGLGLDGYCSQAERRTDETN